jgi:hypothetical protein
LPDFGFANHREARTIFAKKNTHLSAIAGLSSFHHQVQSFLLLSFVEVSA